MKVTQSCPTLCNSMDCGSPVSSAHGISRQEYWSELPFPSPGDLPNLGTEPRSPTLQEKFLPSDPPGKNTGVSSPSLPQGIFPTQESNWGLLHCRMILYQLTYQGSLDLCYFGILKVVIFRMKSLSNWFLSRLNLVNCVITFWNI